MCIKNCVFCFVIVVCYLELVYIYIIMYLKVVVDLDVLNMKFFDREMFYSFLVIIDFYLNI